MNRIKKNSTINYIKLFSLLGVFLFIYFKVAVGEFRFVLICYLILIGLYTSSKIPLFALVVNGILGQILLFATFDYFATMSGITGYVPLSKAAILVMLFGSIGIPYYYKSLNKRCVDEFIRIRDYQLNKITDLEREEASLENERMYVEKEIDKINRLYILGKELVEHLDISDVVENLQKILLSRPGIKSVSIFNWDTNGWSPLAFSNPQYKNRLMEFVKKNKKLHKEDRFRILDEVNWIEDENAVFWPIRLENDLLAAIILTSDVSTAPLYIEEGKIFVPQIALGLKRTKLFTEIKVRSRYDGLTALYLRRYFLERMNVEIQRANRYSSIFSLLLCDIDFFKKVNDTYGHLMGDKVLSGIASTINESVRPGDLVGRYGGEEFIILLPFTSPSDAFTIAREINRNVAAKHYVSDKTKFNVSISIGISHYPAHGTKSDDLVAFADKALYWVKNNGRNGIKDYEEIKDS